MSSSYSISFHGLSISSSLLSFSATSRLLSFAGDCSPGRSEVTYGKSSACLTILFNMDLIILHHFIEDRKSTRLNSSHVAISYAVFCLKKKKQKQEKHDDLST